MKILSLALIAGLSTAWLSLGAQTPSTPTLADRFTELVQRSASGHSPSPEELRAITDGAAPQVTPEEVTAALPMIEKALVNADVPVRTYALVMIDSLRTSPDPVGGKPVQAAAADGSATPLSTTAAATAPSPSTATGPATYKSEIATALAPAIAKIADRLTDESQENRLTAAIILGGFTPNPPAAIYPPLVAFLKRDDAPRSVGLQVVQDLVGAGPIPDRAVAAIAVYLRRPDQTAGTRSDLVDAIASAPNQSRTLNASLLELLFSDDNSLRARLILSLPQLDLAADSFADTRSRVQQLAANDQENLQVVTAAKAISTCWTQPKMTTPCPKYDTGVATPVTTPATPPQ